MEEMSLKEAIKYLDMMKNKINFDLEGYVYGKEAIEIVLNNLKDLQQDNQNLRNYLSEQGMISNYLKWRKKYERN